MKARITIPEPCHADWNQMQPNEKGRHCDQCALTVVDFTTWELQDIATYLQRNAGQRVCGRFHEKQINQSFDLKVFAPQIITWCGGIVRKIAALIVICFAIGSSGCYMGAASKPTDELLGDTVMVEPSVGTKAPAVVDTNAATTLGTPPVIIKKKKKKQAVAAEVVYPPGRTTMGAPIMEPEPHIILPAVKKSSKFQPTIGPPEEEE